MGAIVLNLVFKLLTSDLAKTAIAIGINKLLEAKDDGITKDLAVTMIDAVAKSKANPVTDDVLQDAKKLIAFG